MNRGLGWVGSQHRVKLRVGLTQEDTPFTSIAIDFAIDGSGDPLDNSLLADRICTFRAGSISVRGVSTTNRV